MNEINRNESLASPLISIILPVYNIEHYLVECLDSILNQDYKNWECIIVDDGSTDNSASICEKYEKKDSRFKVLHKENGGLSSARNAGVRLAQGEYVSFVDSDDWIEPDFLSTLLREIQKSDADVAICGFIKEFKSFKRKKKVPVKEGFIEGDRVTRELLLNQRLPNYMCTKLFKREIIGPDFPEGHVFEDIYTMTYWSKKIRKLAFTQKCLYHYRMRKSSITRSAEPKFQFDFIDAVKNRSQVLKELLPDYYTAQDEQQLFYKSYVGISKTIARRVDDKDKREQAISILKDELKNVTDPGKEVLGNKLWKRAQMLLNDTDRFIKKMRLAGAMDLHTRYCETQVYK